MKYTLPRFAAVTIFVIALALSAIAQDSPVKDLGDGFETKTRQMDADTERVLIHFPDKYLQSAEGFKQGVRIGLEKVLGCKQLKCPVELKVEDDYFSVPMRSGFDLKVEIMFQNSKDTSVVGVLFDRPTQRSTGQ